MFADPLPPNGISLTSVLPGPRLIFNWTQTSSDCQEMEYLISSDCGNCPISTAINTAVCVNVPIDDHVCTFEVRTKVCGNIEGRAGTSVFVTLKGIL